MAKPTKDTGYTNNLKYIKAYRDLVTFFSSSDPRECLKRLSPGQFRSTVHTEDLLDEILYMASPVIHDLPDGTPIHGIVDIPFKITLYNTYNPFASLISKKRDSDTLTVEDMKKHGIVGYENPGKANEFYNKSLVGVIAGLSLINKGISANGMKHLTTYIMANHVNQIKTVSWESVHMLVKEAINTPDIMPFIDQHYPGKKRSVSVFYPRDIKHLLSADQRREITLSVLQSKINIGRQELLNNSVEILTEKDSITKVTTARLSSTSGITRRTLERSLTTRQKQILLGINTLRIFKTEKASDKFKQLIENFEDYSIMEVKNVTGSLGISMTTYYQYMDVINDSLHVVVTPAGGKKLNGGGKVGLKRSKRVKK